MRSFQRHVIRDRQGTDSRLRSFRAEPFSQKVHKLVSHEDVNFTARNGWLFLPKNRNSKALETVCLSPAHYCDTVSKGGRADSIVITAPARRLVKGKALISWMLIPDI